MVAISYDKNSSYEIDEEKYKEEFPNIEKIHYVSSKEDFGFCELKQSILLSISKFSKQKIPKKYENVKSEIENKKLEKLNQNKYMLTADEFDEICRGFKLFEERDNIRTILNDIGVMIGFDDDDMHVINPDKMIDKIYEIIRSKKLEDNGTLDFRDAKDRHYSWIMQFLCKNNIALKVDDSKVLLPSRLSVKRPKGFLKSSFMRDDKVYGLNFRYQYKRFKKSVFFDFLLKIQEEIGDVQAQYWGNGIFWKYDEFQALVFASKVDRTIDIHISKDTEKSRKFLTKIRKILDKINESQRDVIQKIAVVDPDDNTIYYKSYHFLKRVKDEKVQLNIKGIPKIFELSNLLDRYEYVEEKVENNKNKPLIITEGKTDKRILEIAWKKLYPDVDMAFIIQASGVEIEEEKNEGSADLVKRSLELDKHENRIIIGIFDNDKEGNNQFKGLKKNIFEHYNINETKRKHLKKQIYGMLLPVPEFRNKFVTSDDAEQRYFVIEHYFSDEVLEKYKMKGKNILNTEVFNVNKGKDTFSSKIKCLDKKEFKNFQLIFDVIQEIINKDNQK